MQESTSQSPKVIQIGFNRCGTLSFHNLMAGSGYAALHWQDAEGRTLAEAMVSNLSTGQVPFAGYEEVQVFSDIAHLSGRVAIEGARFFRDLHAAYPEAYFLFNTRDRGDWLASRAAHSGGNYLKRFCKLTGRDRDGVLALWREYFDNHSEAVRTYFAAQPDARFLHFDLDTDTPEKIAGWLASDFAVDVAHWGHHNRNAQARVMRETLDL